MQISPRSFVVPGRAGPSNQVASRPRDVICRSPSVHFTRAPPYSLTSVSGLSGGQTSTVKSVMLTPYFSPRKPIERSPSSTPCYVSRQSPWTPREVSCHSPPQTSDLASHESSHRTTPCISCRALCPSPCLTTRSASVSDLTPRQFTLAPDDLLTDGCASWAVGRPLGSVRAVRSVKRLVPVPVQVVPLAEDVCCVKTAALHEVAPCAVGVAPAVHDDPSVAVWPRDPGGAPRAGDLRGKKLQPGLPDDQPAHAKSWIEVRQRLPLRALPQVHSTPSLAVHFKEFHGLQLSSSIRSSPRNSVCYPSLDSIRCFPASPVSPTVAQLTPSSLATPTPTITDRALARSEALLQQMAAILQDGDDTDLDCEAKGKTSSLESELVSPTRRALLKTEFLLQGFRNVDGLDDIEPEVDVFAGLKVGVTSQNKSGQTLSSFWETRLAGS